MLKDTCLAPGAGNPRYVAEHRYSLIRDAKKLTSLVARFKEHLTTSSNNGGGKGIPLGWERVVQKFCKKVN